MSLFFSIENHNATPTPTSHFNTFPKSDGPWEFPAQAMLLAPSKVVQAPPLATVVDPSPFPIIVDLSSRDELNENDRTMERRTMDQDSIASQDSLAYAYFSDDDLLSVFEGESSSDPTPFLEQDYDSASLDEALVNDFLQVFPDGWTFESIEQSIQELKRSNCEASTASGVTEFADSMCTFKELASQEEFHDMFITAGGVSAVTKAMIKYPKSEQVQRSGASALAAVTECHEPSRREIIRCGGIELSVRMLSNFPENEAVLRDGAFALKTLMMCHYRTSAKYCVPSILAASRAGAAKELIKALKKYPNNDLLCLEVCSCLHHLVLFKKTDATLALRDGARDTVGKTIVTFRDSPAIQNMAIALMTILTFVRDGCVSPPVDCYKIRL